MQVKLSLALPQDAQSVSLVRGVCGRVLQTLGVTDDCIHDVQVVIGEACSNVMRHAAPRGEYEVVVVVRSQVCVLQVVDHGGGFIENPDVIPVDGDAAESGRGIPLMRALVDRLHFESTRGDGTQVRMVKALEFTGDAPLAGLGEPAAPTG